MIKKQNQQKNKDKVQHQLAQDKIIIYKAKNKKISLKVRLEKETVWLTQLQIANLFNINVPAISKHIKNIFKQGELKRELTVSKMETVQREGKRIIKREIYLYNLDMKDNCQYCAFQE